MWGMAVSSNCQREQSPALKFPASVVAPGSSSLLSPPDGCWRALDDTVIRREGVMPGFCLFLAYKFPPVVCLPLNFRYFNAISLNVGFTFCEPKTRGLQSQLSSKLEPQDRLVVSPDGWLVDRWIENAQLKDSGCSYRTGRAKLLLVE